MALGEENVKGQGGFTRTGDARDDRELVAGNLDRDIFEVVFAGMLNVNGTRCTSG